jgi:hypothetical protein
MGNKNLDGCSQFCISSRHIYNTEEPNESRYDIVITCAGFSELDLVQTYRHISTEKNSKFKDMAVAL